MPLQQSLLATLFLGPVSFDDRLIGIALIAAVAALLAMALLAGYALAVQVRASRVQALVKEQTAGITNANRTLELEISQRRLAEAHLRESEARYRALVESSPDGVIIHNEGKIIFANSAAANLVGLAETPELILRSVQDFVHPDYHSAVAERARHMLTQNLNLPPLEMTIVRDDGSQVQVEANGARIVMPDGAHAIQTIIRDITSRKQTEETLADRARQLAQAQSIAHLGSWEWEIASNTVTWSDELYRIFGLLPQEFGATYEAYLERVHRDDRQIVNQVIENALAHHQPFSYEYRIIRPDGTIRFAHSQGEVIVDDHRMPLRMIGACQDITERKRADQEMRQISSALESAVEGIARLDASGHYIFVNAAYAAMLGYDAGQMAGMSWRLSVHPDDRETITLAYKELAAAGRVEAEVRGLRRDGSEFYKRVVMVASHDDDGNFAGHYCFMQDISARKFAEDLVKHMALHDPLTALANRRLLHDRFAMALAQARRTGEPLAVASLDLDDFKNLNDMFGHATGDQVLRTVGRRLASAVREGDTVARIGGDEFLLLLPNTGRAGAATITARILREAVKRTALEGTDFHASFSVGIAMFPDDGDDADTLLNCSDAAMYQAKKLGGNKYHFATEDLAIE